MKKAMSYLLLTALFYCQHTVAQAPKKIWDVRFGGNSYDYCYDVHQTSDGGYILGGTSRSDISGDKSQSSYGGDEDYWIVKTDPDGVKQWDYRYGNYQADYFTCIQQTIDGGYILGGYGVCHQNVDHSTEGFGDNDAWIIKVDSTGVKEWDITHGGDKDDELYALEQTSDGGYILGISAKSKVKGNKTSESKGGIDYWIVKTDANGTEQWEVAFGTNEDDHLRAIHQTTDGGFIIGGYTSQGVNQDKSGFSKGRNDYWIIKTDANGVKQWDKGFGGSDDDYLSDILLTQDGGYLLGGSSDSPASGDLSQGTSGSRDYWIVKIDDNGTKEWEACFGGWEYDVFTSLSQSEEGGYLLSGYSNSLGSGEKSQFPRGEEDYWVIKVNDSGVKEWDVRYGGTDEDVLTASSTTSNGAYVLAGYSLSGSGADKTQSSQGYYDYWMVKMNGKGARALLTVPVTKYTFLRNESLTISYTALGTFKSGNIFSAELSDANGSFASPAIIGSIPSTTSGEIPCVIPGAAAYGNGYRIRVVSSKPEVESEDNGINLIIATASAPQKEWDATFGGASNDDLEDIIETIDGGYLIAGTSYSGLEGDKTQTSWGHNDYWIVKTSASGVKQWDKRYGGTGYDELKKVFQLNDGSYILAGTSGSEVSGDKTKPSYGGWDDYWIIKIDSNGNKLWDNTYGDTEEEVLVNFEQDANSGFTLYGVYGYLWDQYALIVRIDSDGNQLDAVDLYLNLVNSAIRDNDGRYVLSGSENTIQQLVKYKENGNPQWTRDFDGSDCNWLQSRSAISQTSDNGYLLPNSSHCGIGGDKTEENRGGDINNGDFWIVKADSMGYKVWDRTLGGSNDDYCSYAHQVTDGYLSVGKSNSPFSYEKTHFQISDYDAWIIKTDLNGIKQWDLTFGGSADGDENIKIFKQTSDGGYILGGVTNSDAGADVTDGSNGGTDYWVIKLAAEPKEATSFCDTPIGTITSNIKSTSAKVNWNVVPTAQTYSVRYRKSGTVPWTKTTAQLNYKKLTGLLPNTQYDWAVKSVCDQGSVSSDWSETQTFTTKPLRLENDDEEIAFNVFPNPSAGVFTVDLTVNDEETMQTKFEVLNIFGQVIHSEDGEIENGRLVKEIEMGNAPDGIYLVRLFINGQVYTSQISLQR